MARALLLILLPIVVPLLLYVGYLKFIKRPAPAGDTGEAEVRERSLQKTLFWIVLGVFVVVVAAFGTLRFGSAAAPDTTQEGPRPVDGKIVPSRPVE